MGEQLNDDTVEHLLSGNRDSDELGRLLGAIKAEFAAIDAPEPSPGLLAFIDNASHAAAPAPTPIDELSIARKRRRRFAAVAATGTTLGKLMIGVSAAAASVAGMHATGLVDVPVLLDRRTPADSVATDDTNRAPATTAQATVSRETTVPADVTLSFDAADAGTVNIGVANTQVVSAVANADPGWKSQVNTTNTEVDIAFNRSGDALDVRAVLDGDLLHVVISDHRNGTTEEFWLDTDSKPTLPDQAPQPQQPPKSIPTPESTPTHDNTSDDDNKSDDNESDDNKSDDDNESDDNKSDDNKSDDDTSDDDTSDDDSTSDDDTSDDDNKSDDHTSSDDDDDDKSDDHTSD